MLEVSSINTFYGDSHILFNVDLQIGAGEVVALLGRNGAGKSTTLRSIMGLTPPRSGTILFQGRSIGGAKPYQICRLGIGFVPEDRRIFPRLTVQENLEIAVRQCAERSAWTVRAAYDLFPRLDERRNNMGHQLSGGEQQMLTIARALMTNPSLLLLDEPSEGLAPVMVAAVGDVVQAIRREGISILLIEQNAQFALRLSDRAYLIDDGRMRFSGTVDEIKSNTELMARYLGV
jgi:branched-chain amino acid transport system ATP-binding protein